jgi:hypothetical protein
MDTGENGGGTTPIDAKLKHCKSRDFQNAAEIQSQHKSVLARS